MKKKLLTMTLCLVVSFASSAYGGNGADGTTAGKTDTATEGALQVAGPNTVVAAMDSGLSTLDPRYICEKHPSLIVNACYESLSKFYSNDSAPEPYLIDTYESSEDGLTLIVKLRQDVTFASDNSMANVDALFSTNRYRSLQGDLSFIHDIIENMEVLDDYAVVLHLTQPDSVIPPELTCSSTAVLDNTAMKEHGGMGTEDASSTGTAQSYLDMASMGSGMYAVTSYILDQEVVLEKNSDYWGGATNVDRFIIKIQPDANAQMMTLSGGDIGVTTNMIDDIMSELEGAENASIINGAAKTVGFMMMNMDEAYSGPMSNPQVQNAIHKALGYIGIQTICGSDTTTPYDIIQVGFMGSKSERPTDHTSLEEAKALLAGVGYPDGLDVDLVMTDLDMEEILLTDLIQKIRDDLSQVGINIDIVPQLQTVGYGDTYRDGALGFTVMYQETDYNGPNVQLEFLLDEMVGKRAGQSADMDPELATIYEKTMSIMDNDARTAVLEEVQDAVYEHGPFIVVAQAPSHIDYNIRLEGVAISNPYVLDLTLTNVE